MVARIVASAGLLSLRSCVPCALCPCRQRASMNQCVHQYSSMLCPLVDMCWSIEG